MNIKHMDKFITLFVILFTFYIFYPGQLSIDTFIQLKQSQTSIYNDWQPPIMSYLLRLFSHVTTPTALFILAQILCFSIGSYLLFKAWQSGHKSDYIYLLIPLLPPVFTLIGVVWKDIFFASLLFLTFCATEYIKNNPLKTLLSKSSVLILFLVLLAIAQMFRTNGLFFTLFLCSYFVKTLWENKISRALVYLLAIVHAVITIWFTQYFNYTFLGAEKTRPLQYTMYYDLVGISRFAQYNYVPSFAMPSHCDTFKLTDIYDYHGGDNLFADTYYNKNECKLNWVKNDQEYSQLQNAWLGAIKSDVVSYIIHRFYFFASFLKLDSLKPNVAVYINTDVNEFGINYEFNMIRKAVIGLYYTLTLNPFFYPWFYFVILILSQLKFVRFRVNIDFDIFAGCMLYMLGFAVFGPGQVYRYTYPVAVILTALILRHLMDAFRNRKRRQLA